jgi:hypothetical protein
MTVRKMGSWFFFLYGFLLPIMASDFMERHFWASIAIVFCCLVISILLLLNRCDFFNILISFFIFKVYLIRPYVDIFSEKLSDTQLSYIQINNQFFNTSDAIVVYFSILSLLIAWLAGLLASRPINSPVSGSELPRIFRRLDSLIANADWRFWVVFLLFIFLNYTPANVNWQGIAGGQGKTLFAYGLINPSHVGLVCFVTFLFSRGAGNKSSSWILLAPVVFEIVFSTAGGSRGAAFLPFVYAVLCLVFLNHDERIYLSIKKLLFICGAALSVPLIILVGLLAQTLKPLLRTKDIENSKVLEAFGTNLNFFDSDNMIIRDLYFGLTELLHRLSALQAQFTILNDNFINSPWESFNPLNSLMRMINDLVPGTPFPGMLTINQLFNHIYFDEFVQYSSHMWGIQGTLYIYVGAWLSPLIVFLIAFYVSRYWDKIKRLLKKSPAFLLFVMVLTLDILENGTIERIVPVDVVRPLVSFFVLTSLVRLLYILVPKKKKLSI